MSRERVRAIALIAYGATGGAAWGSVAVFLLVGGAPALNLVIIAAGGLLQFALAAYLLREVT